VYWTWILAALALTSVGLVLWQWWLGMRFPLHRAPLPLQPRPAVTLLKPLKGCDEHTEQCLRGWLNQKYDGPTQVLFGVAEPSDPVVDLVRRLIQEYPMRDAELIICPKRFGANAKISTLIQLARLAKHDLFVVSDADVCPPEELLPAIALELADPATGLASCLYAQVCPSNFWMRLEAVAVNADFWTQVLQARSLNKMDFALGAVMAFRSKSLAAVGGFEALADYLADDYQLGHRIAATGAAIKVCPVVVECWASRQTAREVWAHQVRWARTIRVCNPVQYFFSILGNATLWTLVFAMFGQSGRAFGWSSTLGTAFLVFSMTWGGVLMLSTIILRILSALLLQQRITRRTDHFPWWFLPPIKDLFGAAVWGAAFLGSTIYWRGKRYRVNRNGKLVDLQI
jgi:ceramide glucosyltransferase